MSADKDGIAILIDSLQSYMLQIQQTNLLLKCADFFLLAITFRQYSMSVCLFCWRIDATAIFLWLFQFFSWLLHQKSGIKLFVWIDACVFFLCRIKKGKMAKILKGRFHPRNKKVYFSKLLMGISPYAFFHRVLNLCVYCALLLFLYAIKRCFNIEFVVFEQIGNVCVLLNWKLKNELCCFFQVDKKSVDHYTEIVAIVLALFIRIEK